MPYIPDDTTFSLEQVEKRILDTDLIPSMEVLKTCISSISNKLRGYQIRSLEEIRIALKTKAKLHQVSCELKINEEHLVLLKREIDGWKPKVRKIDELNWIKPKEISVLKTSGITTSEDAYNHLSNKKEMADIIKRGISSSTIEEVYKIASLLRVRWVSPTFGRIINDIGYDVEKLKKANAEMLTKETDDYNKSKQYYKGKVGVRDIRRLINEAQYVN